MVVEAARKSGSLITAGFANEQGRLVFAVPGSPLDPRAEGGNHLIREGATLCAEAAHVIDALTPLLDNDLGFLPPPPALRDGAGEDARQALWDELDLPGIGLAPVAAVPEPESITGTMSTAPDAVDLRRVVLHLLGSAPISIDDLVRASGRSAREISHTLLDLELDNLIRRHPGGALTRVED